MADYNRSYFADELADQRLRDRLFALTQAEVGGQGPDAQQAFLETVFNRAASRGMPLANTMSLFNPRTREGYYPSLGSPSLLSDDQRNYYGNLLTRVMAGSDISGGATGNASGTVGFAGGPQTSAFGGERFGVEGPDVGRSLPRFMQPASINQRVAQSFEDLQGGGATRGITPAGAALASGTLPSAPPSARSIPPEFMGGESSFGGGNLPLILMALGGGIAQGGIGPGLTNAAQLAAYINKSQGTPADVKEYQYAVSTGMFNGSYQDWLKFKANVGNKGGLNTIYYKDAQGRVRAGQMTTGGEFRDVNIPGDVMLPQMQIDQGTGTTLTPRVAVPGAPGVTTGGAPGAQPPAGSPQGGNAFFPKNVSGKAEQTQQGDFFGKQYAEFQKESINSTRVKGILDYTARLAPDAYSGAAAPLVQNIRSALSTFGIDPGKAPVGDMLTSLGNEMTIRSLGGLGRQISDGDRIYMASVFPSLADTAEGRMMKIEALQKMAQRQEDVAAAAEKWVNANGSLKGFAQALAKWSDENPLFPDPRKQGGGGSAPNGGWSIQRLQ